MRLLYVQVSFLRSFVRGKTLHTFLKQLYLYGKAKAKLPLVAHAASEVDFEAVALRSPLAILSVRASALPRQYIVSSEMDSF